LDWAVSLDVTTISGNPPHCATFKLEVLSAALSQGLLYLNTQGS
jgi:hypothetical protein